MNAIIDGNVIIEINNAANNTIPSFNRIFYNAKFLHDSYLKIYYNYTYNNDHNSCLIIDEGFYNT